MSRLPNATALDTATLARLVEQKHTCLGALLALSQEQSALVSGGDVMRLLQLLDAKGRLVSQLESVHAELDRFRDQDPASRQWASDEARARCAQLNAEAEQFFAQVIELERTSEERLILRRDEAARQLTGVHTASQARGAYADNAPPRGESLNLETN